MLESKDNFLKFLKSKFILPNQEKCLKKLMA